MSAIPMSTKGGIDAIRARLEAAARPRAPDRLPHGFLVPAAARAQPLVDRLPCRGAAARRELLRPARLGGAARQPVRHRQGRHPDQSLVPARPAGRRDRLQRRADVVVRLDVRISDAAAGHEGAAWRHPQPDQQSGHQAADAVRPLQAHSVGHLGSGLQRPRPRDDLPVHEFRRARPRPEARAGAQHRHRALCHGACRAVQAARGGGQSRTPARRSARSAITASTTPSTSRRSACPKAPTMPSSTTTWRTIRACRWWRSPT